MEKKLYEGTARKQSPENQTESSKVTKAVDTLILHFKASELQEDKFMLIKVPDLRYFAKVVRAK